MHYGVPLIQLYYVPNLHQSYTYKLPVSDAGWGSIWPWLTLSSLAMDVAPSSRHESLLYTGNLRVKAYSAVDQIVHDRIFPTQIAYC